MAATQKSVKHKKRICNYRVFCNICNFRGELLSLPLYSANYAKDASAAIDKWMLINQAATPLALMPPRAEPLALMAPTEDMNGLD
eukprot:6424696-Prymnesium_polylepis.1